MFGSVILDVAIGLILVFLLLSLVTATVQETLAGARHRRAKTLLRGIRELLRDEALVDAFYQHPRIAALYRGKWEEAKRSGKLPSYIPADAFSSALLDMAVRGRNHNATLQAGSESNVLTLQSVRQNISNLGDVQVQRLVLSAADAAQGDLAMAHAGIEAWFNGAMDRVAGWYKRDTQVFLFLIGLVVTVLLDVDTIQIARDLYRDPARRDAAIAMAGAVTQEARQPSAAGTAADSAARAASLSGLAKGALDSLSNLGIPIGWKDNGVDGLPSSKAEWKAIGTHVGNSWFGWLFTAIAVSFGAPFWFDMLNKVMVIRSTVKPREKSREEGSEDRASKDRPGGGSSAIAGSPPPQVIVVTPTGATAHAATGGAGGTAGAVAFTPHEWESGHAQGGIL